MSSIFYWVQPHKYEHNKWGEVTKETNALGFANESVYDGNGQLTSSIDALGHTTKYEYDALGRQTKVTNALGITASTSQYDAVGNLIQQTDANGRSVTNVYDDNNRLIEQKNALNQVAKHDYDKAGRKIATESPDGAKKQFKYNSISQLYQVLDGLNQSTLYTYDSQGKLLTQTDANKQTTRFAYNDLGQRVSRTLPEGQVESAAYNTQGDLLSTKSFKGETTTFKYNGKEQLESITYPDKRVITHSYNAKGDLTETKDSQSGSLTYQRDDLGQTLKVTTPTGELGYTWNGNGQKLSQSINQLGSYQYSYDALGRIVAVEAIDGSLTQFGYDDVGNRTHIKRTNGSESFYSYNDINQLTKLEHKQGNQTLASFEYKLDNMGRKVEAKEIIDGQTRTINYEYDIEGRLLAEKITEAGKTSEIRYTHDAQGNRLTKLENGEKTAYSYNKNDQLLTETISKTDGTSTTINYGWDANGNLLSKKSSDQTIDIQYGWNSANRLIKVTEESKTTTYQYDGEDRRIGKVITDGTNTTETQYLIDSERNYDEIIVAKTRITTGTQVGDWKEELYLYAPDGVGDLLLQSEVGTEHLYQDGKGSTRLVVNNNGTKTTFDYDAFGNPLAKTNPQNHIKHRYVGEVLDEETGFYYFRARHYDPKIGRFISRDSFEGVKTTPISLNPYLYAHSDPVNIKDPTGHFGLMDINISQSIQSTLNYMARDYLQDYVFGKIFEGTIDQPGLFDLFTMLIMKTMSTSAEVPEPTAMSRGITWNFKPSEDHHTIPQYMCGPTRYDLTAKIDGHIHDKIHGKMRAYTTSVDVASYIYQVAFRYKRPKIDIRTPTKDLAVKPFGRVAISTAIDSFYILNGYWMTPVLGPNRVESKSIPFTQKFPVLGGYFNAERALYILPDAIKNRASSECKKLEKSAIKKGGGRKK